MIMETSRKGRQESSFERPEKGEISLVVLQQQIIDEINLIGRERSQPPFKDRSWGETHRFEFDTQKRFQSEDWLLRGQVDEIENLRSFGVDLDKEIYSYIQRHPKLKNKIVSITKKIGIHFLKICRKNDIQIDKQAFLRRLYSGMARVIILQSEIGTAHPKPYHNPNHTIKVVIGILEYLETSPKTMAYLGPESANLLCSAVIHDTIMYLNYRLDSFSVNKHRDNEMISALGMTLDGKMEHYNYQFEVMGTKLEPGNFQDGYIMVARILNKLLKSKPHPKSKSTPLQRAKRKFSSTLVGHYDTRSRDPQDFLRNSLAVWAEEFVIPVVYKALKKNYGDNMVSEGRYEWTNGSQRESISVEGFMMRTLDKLKSYTSVGNFIWFLKDDISRYFGESMGTLISTELDKSLKSFISLQSTVAHNFKDNAQNFVEALEQDEHIPQDIIQEYQKVTNYEQSFSEMMVSSAIINLFCVRTLECSNFDNNLEFLRGRKLWRYVEQVKQSLKLNSGGMQLIMEHIGSDFSDPKFGDKFTQFLIGSPLSTTSPSSDRVTIDLLIKEINLRFLSISTPEPAKVEAPAYSANSYVG